MTNLRYCKVGSVKARKAAQSLFQCIVQYASNNKFKTFFDFFEVGLAEARKDVQ